MKTRPSLLAAASSLFLATAARAQDAASDAQEIVVSAQKNNQTQVTQGGQVGILGDKDGLDVPFNIRSYSAALIQNQQSETLGQVLENDPSVRTTLGFGNSAEQFVIRGFPLYGDDVSIDGLYGVTPRQLVSPELYDSVQILNGASAFLNGAAPGGSGIGGGVNLVFKRAGDTPLTRLTVGFQEGSIFEGSADVGRRFGDNGEFGVRLNAMEREGDSNVDGEHHQTTLVGGSFDWRGDRARASLDVGYQRDIIDRMRPTVTVSGTSIPAAPSPTTNYGQDYTFTELRDVFGVASLEYDITDHIVAYAKAGARDGSERGNYSSVSLTNAVTGDGTGYGFYVPRTDDNESIEGGVRGDVTTGPIEHEFNVGGTSIWEINRNAYAFSSPSYATNIYHPPQVALPINIYTGGDLADVYPISRTSMQSVYFSDTLSAFDGRVQLIAGGREQYITVVGYSYFGGLEDSRYDKSALTPVVGLVFKPTAETSVYFNRIEGLAEGPTAPSTVLNPNQIFSPYTSVQYETGAKYEAGSFSATLALYQIEQPSAYTNAANYFVVDGNQRNRGIEFNVSGEPLPGLRVIGGGAYIDTTQQGTAGGTLDGKQAVGVPNYTINANVEYDLPMLEGTTVTGRVTHTGEQYVDAANTLKLPDWTTLDLGARYVLLADRNPVTLRFGVDNVTDNAYWASAFGGYLLQGGPRTFKFSASVDL
jgi:iron complex outermembrane receptor protein